MLPPKDEMKKIMSQQERLKREENPDVNPETPQAIDGFGPPDFGNQEGFNEEEINQSYEKAFGADHEDHQNPLFEMEDEGKETQEEKESHDFGFNPPPPWQGTGEYPEPPSFRQESGSFLTDDEIFEGGPPRTMVASWKKQFEIENHTINLTEIGDLKFIWRTLNRIEYREIMSLPNTDPLQREEIICEICVLFPYDYDFTSMASGKAGIPAVLAEQIMQESSFRKPSPPIRL